MRRFWTLCALLLSLTASVSTAAAVTRSSLSHTSHWVKITKLHKRAMHKPAKRSQQKGASSTPTATAALAGGDPVLFGDQSVESGVDSNSSGLAQAFPFIDNVSGSAQSIAIYLDSHSRSRTLIAGVYSDASGHPGKLLASGSKRSPTSGAWNTITITSTTVASGSKYWLAVLGKGGALSLREISSGTCRSENSAQTSLSALPSTWKSGRTSATCPVSAYVSGTEASSPSSSGTTGLVAPSNTTPPTVTGATTVGQTLTTDNGSWTNLPTSYAYAWQDCDTSANNCTTIIGAASSSYTLTAGDGGHTLRSVVTASNLLGSGTATSAPTAVVVQPAPANTALPTVSGPATQGQTLTASNGTWTNGPTSFKHVWQDCDGSGNTCATISGATSASYTLASGDVGHTIRTIVTATNSGGSTSVNSAATALVAAPAPAASFTVNPASPVTGQPVTFDAGGASCGAAPCTYSWADDPPSGGSFDLGTGQVLQFTFQNVGTKYVTLTVTDAQNRTATAEQDVAVVAPAPSPPANTSAPAVSGTAQQGSTVTTTNGSWSNSPTSYTYAWQDCNSSGSSCTAISGATASSYKLGSSDVGHTIRSAVTAGNTAGTSMSQSSPSAAVTSAPASPPSNTAAPTVSGAAQQGQTLTAGNGTWTNSPTLYAYAWEDCDTSGNACTIISGATASTYTLSATDVGKTLRVVVTASNSAGTGSATSQASATVASQSSTSCNLNATTSNFSSQFAALQGGQTLCLASGNYGTFAGGSKASRVTIEPASGASVTMALNWSGVSNITVTGMTISSALIQGASHDLTISNSTVSPGFIHLLTDQFNHSNILIDHDAFPNTIATGGQGRVWTDFNTVNTTNIIGVTVSNSLFTGGDMIDILIEGGAGLQVLNNEFTGMDNTINENIHSDTIFNYGDQGHNVMKGNWFHDQVDVPACGWAQWDGGDDNVFENNVISHSGGATGHDGCYESMSVLDDSNSVIAHNVIEPGTGEAGPLGQIDVGGKSNEGAGSGTIIRDNVMSEIDNGNGGLNATYGASNNLCANGCNGTGNITGKPTFAAGAAPTSFAGFALAPGSPGIGAASDGTNMGIELPTGG